MKIKNYPAANQDRIWRIIIEGSEWSKIIGQSETKLQKEMQVAGFRRGTAPPSRCRAMMARNDILQTAHRLAWPQVYHFARQNIKGWPSTVRPQVTVEKINFREYWVSLRCPVEAHGSQKLKQYQDFTVPIAKTVTVSDDEVNEQLKMLQKKRGVLETIDRPAQLGDVVTIDYEGYLNNQKIKHSEIKNFQLELGSHQTINDFENQLVGSKSDQTIKINVKMPANHLNVKLQNQLLTFKVRIKQVATYNLPSLNQLLKQLTLPSNVTTITQLQQHTRQQLLAEKKTANKMAFVTALVKIIAKDSQLTPPTAELRAKFLKLKQHFANELQQRRLSLRTYKRKTGVSDDVINAEFIEEARLNLLRSMVLQEVSERENIKPSPDQITAELTDHQTSVKTPVSAVVKQNIIAQLTERLTVNFLFNHNHGILTADVPIQK